MDASLPAAAVFTPAGLTGRWRVARVIEDRLAGGTARLVGEAVFAPDAEGLCYDESGTLTLPGGQSLAASRRYLWRFGATVQVLFADGRLFHILDPRDPEAELVHLCGEDDYRGRYLVTATGWETEWRVRGPRKDQVSRIAYVRP